MNLQMKFTASKVDEIEKMKGVPIQNCVVDQRISMLTTFIEKGVVNPDGTVGTTKNAAMRILDEYLENNDTSDLILDVMEALTEGGFLSRQLDIEKLRSSAKEEAEKALAMI